VLHGGGRGGFRGGWEKNRKNLACRQECSLKAATAARLSLFRLEREFSARLRPQDEIREQRSPRGRAFL